MPIDQIESSSKIALSSYSKLIRINMSDFAKAFLSSTLCMEIGYNKSSRGTKTVNAFNPVSEDPVYAFQHLTENKLSKRLTNVKVGNFISSTEASKILVVSQWKSGSSFIGHLLNA